MPYTITLHMSAPFTKESDGATSPTGHMWYSIDDGKGRVDSFGFAPSDSFNGMNYNGQPFAPGKVYPDDIGRYLDKNTITGGSSINTQTYPISEAQYRTLLDYGQNPVKYGFDASTYNGASNNCINFTWTALQSAGLNPTGYQGTSLPILNKDDVAFNMSVVEFANNYIADQQARADFEKALLGQYGDNQAAWNVLDRQFNKLMEDLSKSATANHMKLGDYIKQQFSAEIAKGEAWLKQTGQRIEDIGAEVVKTGKMGLDLILSIEHLFQTSKQAVSPLELDLTGNGVQTVGQAAGVYFNYSGNGLAQSTGWTAPQDGLLVLPDANGQVTQGSELFGNNTVLPDGTLAPNGFAALAALDSNHDGVIDSNDPVFSKLRIWVGGNGQPGSGQLLTLAQAGIKSLSTSYISQNVVDSNGNQILEVGSYTLTNGTMRAMDDVWYSVDPEKTKEVNPIALSGTIAALPNLSGSGTLHSLQQTMARDTSGKLAGLVQTFANGAETMTPQDARAAAEAILRNWTGADRYSATSRGSYIDGRDLYVLEAFLGQGFTQGAGTNVGTNQPGPVAAATLEQAYSKLLDWVVGQLLAQTRFAPWLNDVKFTWNTATQNLAVDTSALMARLSAGYKSAPAQASSWMYEFGSSLKGMGDYGKLILSTLQQQGNIAGQEFSFALATMGYTEVFGNAGTKTLSGVPNRDTLLIGFGNETLVAADGDDVLIAGSGQETLNAGSGNDTFIFNKGNGQVVLNEVSATQKAAGKNQDVLRLGADIALAGTQITRDVSNNLILAFGNGDQVTISGYFDQAANVPLILFADGTSWNFGAVTSQVVFRDTTSGGHTLVGLAGANNRIIGAAGDTIFASNLNDTITAGTNNMLNAGVGTDTFIVNPGSGHVTLNESYNKTAGANQDVVQLGAGITASGTQITRDLSDNLVLAFGNGDQLTITGYFSQTSNRPKLVFTDGTTWDYNAITSQLLFTDTSAGNRWLYGLQGVNNRIVGATGDAITAGNLNDTITAGKNNTLNSGAGVDTFIVNQGMGHVTLNDAYGKTGGSNQDMVQFGAGITATGTQIARDPSNNLILSFDNGDQLTITGYFNQASNQPKLVFIDGTSWDYHAITSQLLFADTSAGNRWLSGLQGVNNRIVGATGDTITAGNLNDTITAGKNNTLNSGAGVDTFIVNQGMGNVTLNDSCGKTGGMNQDVVQLGAGIAVSGTQITRDLSNNLVLSFGNGDQLTIAGYFNQTSNQPKLIFADGTSWDYQAITSQLLFIDTSAGNRWLSGLQSVNNRIVGATGDTITAGNLNDTITAGKNNTLNSGAGVDTFIVNQGMGHVTLNDSSSKTGGANQDVVQLGAGITASGTQITRDLSDNLVLSFGNGDQLTITGYFSQTSNRPKLVFTDGTSWDYQAITSQLLFTDTSAGNRWLSGLQGVNNRIVGATGDTITAGNLNDTITAGKNNTLNSGAGVDTFIVNQGMGHVTLNDAYGKTGGSNQDMVQFGAGISATGTQIARDPSNNLILSFGNGDQLTITGYFNQASNQPKLVFTDGTSWDYKAITTQLGSTSPPPSNPPHTIMASKNSTLNADTDIDVFIINQGAGQLRLNESYGKTGGTNQDLVQLGAGITAAGTQIARDPSNNLTLSFGNGDQLTITGYFNQPSNQPKLVFSDSTSWDYKAITDQLVFTDTSVGNRSLSGLQGVNNRIVGATGDTITAGNLNDTITAGKNNTLSAGTGTDTFIINQGTGQVRLNDLYGKAGSTNQDVVQLGAGITVVGTQIARDPSNNLILSFGNGDQLTITGYFNQPLNQPKLVFVDGTSWDYKGITDRLVFTDTSAGNQSLCGLQGVNNRIVGAAGDTITAGNLNDTITAGKNNVLNAGAGTDTFIVNQGAGHVRLYEAYGKTGGMNQDVVQLGAGITAIGTQIARDPSNTLILSLSSGDQLTISGYFSQVLNQPKLVFTDGTSWDYNAITSQLVFTDASAGNQSLSGLQGVNNRIVGAAGDTITAGNLNDMITAGKNNSLNAGVGADTFIVNPGSGHVTLNESSSKIGGTNQDLVQLGAGITAVGTQIARDPWNNLILSFGNGDQLTITGYFREATNQPKLTFADGTSWNYKVITDQLVFTDTSAGNQTLYGLQGVNNRMVGASGDTITAGNLNDTITAGKNNSLNAGVGADTFIVNPGAGHVTLNESSNKIGRTNQDVVQLGAGITAAGTQIARDPWNNLILSFGNDDQLTITGYFREATNQPKLTFADGTSWDYKVITDQLVFTDTSAGNQMLYGLQGVNNRMVGASGDTITAGNLNDTLTAGKNNTLNAGVGTDTFIVNNGSGHVTLIESSSKTGGSNQDVVQLGTGIAATSTQIARDSSNLALSFGNGDQLTITGYFSQASNQPKFVFADGTGWDYQAVVDRLVYTDTIGNRWLYGQQGVSNRIVGAAGDTIVAGNLNDTITAGANNTLDAGAGIDTFIVNQGAGHVTLNESPSKTGGANQDVVRLGADIAAKSTQITRDSSDNLILTFGTGDQLTITAYFRQALNQPGLVFADGTSWDYKAITDQLVYTDTIGNHSLYGLQGVNNRIVGATGDTIVAGNLNDAITAGTNNTLNAGAGIDTFIVNQGTGHVTLNEASNKACGSNQDVVQLGAGITVTGTQITRDLSDNLVLAFGNGDQLTITGYFSQALNQPKIVFADGTSLNYKTITDQLTFTDTSTGNRWLHGLQGVNNRIVGAAGDTIYAGNLNDTITASKNDTLNAGAGTDTFIVNQGMGQVTLNESNNKTGSTNQDVVQLGAGITVTGTQITRDLSDNLALSFGNGNQLTINGYFNQPLSRPKFVFADGTNLDYQTVTDRLIFTDTSAGNHWLYGLQGVDNRIIGATSDTLIAGNLNDTLTAGKNDTLNAGAGIDTFILNQGMGQVTLNESSNKTGSTNQDVVQLGAGITAAGTQITRDLSDNLALSFGNGDQLTINGYFNQPLSRPKLVFDDGTNLDYKTVTDRLVFTDTSAGNHWLYGLQGVNNRIVGAASDTLIAGNLNDTLTAGKNDTLNAGAGTDAFIINQGMGQVTLNESNNKTGSMNQDVVQLGAGITATGTQITRDLSNNLVLAFGNGDQLTISGYFNQPSNQPKLVFADGTSWNYKTITDKLTFTDTSAGNQWLYGLQGVNNRIVGAAGDTIVAGNLNDTITAGKNDTLNAGAGIDTFIVNQGAGHVTLNEAISKTGGSNQDVVQFAGNVASDQLWMRQLGNNLEVDVIGTGDSLTLNGWYSGGSSHAHEFKAGDGKVLLDADVAKLVNAMASFAPPAAGQTTLTPQAEAALKPVIAANWH